MLPDRITSQNSIAYDGFFYFKLSTAQHFKRVELSAHLFQRVWMPLSMSHGHCWAVGENTNKALYVLSRSRRGTFCRSPIRHAPMACCLTYRHLGSWFHQWCAQNTCWYASTIAARTLDSHFPTLSYSRVLSLWSLIDTMLWFLNYLLRIASTLAAYRPIEMTKDFREQLFCS